MIRFAPAVLAALLGATALLLTACTGESGESAATDATSNGERTVVPAANVTEVTFDVKGMHCDGCVNTIDGEVAKLDHVVGCEVSLEDEVAVVKLDDVAAADEVEQTIKSLGFEVARR